MFTPPPSPFPSPQGGITSGEEKAVEEETTTTTERKSRLGRRTKWTAVLIPFALMLTTASTHYFTHPAIFDFFLSQPTEINWKSIGLLHKRHPDASTDSSSVITPSPSPSPTSTILDGASSTSASTILDGASSTSASATVAATAQPIPTIPASAPTLPTPFPQPWDSDISFNFSTQNCYTFFQSMLNDQSFRSCRPFSLLLQSSNVFSQSENNLTLMNEIVWGTCNTTLGQDQCASNMASFAQKLKTECAKDLSDENANAVQTLIGLETYTVMSTTACLSDPTTNTYCFLNALHNTNPSDLYYYQLPLGISVPTTSVPTCSACTKNLLGVYVNALQSDSSGNGTDTLSALASVYSAAEQLAVGTCGQNYALPVTSAVASNRSNAVRALREGRRTLVGVVLGLGIGWWIGGWGLSLS